MWNESQEPFVDTAFPAFGRNSARSSQRKQGKSEGFCLVGEAKTASS